MTMTQKQLEIKKDLITYEILLERIIVRNLYDEKEIEALRMEIENEDNDDYKPNIGQCYIDSAYSDIESIREEIDELMEMDYGDELEYGLTVAEKIAHHNTVIEYLGIIAEYINALL